MTDSTPNVSATQPAGSRSVVGGSLAAICFFLPWMQVSCMGEKKTFSGAQLAGESGMLWLVLLAAVSIVVIALHFRSQGRAEAARTMIVAASVLALAVIAFQYLRLNKGIETPEGRMSAAMLSLSWQIGLYGTIAGFGVALYDALMMMIPIPAPHMNAASGPDIRMPAVIASTSANAAGAALRARGWLMHHRGRLGTLGIGLLALGGGYVLVRPKPAPDGKRAGAMFAKCRDDYRSEAERIQARMLAKFRSSRPATRSAATHEVEKALTPARNFYSTCLEDARGAEEKFSRRWGEKPQKYEEYQTAFREAAAGALLAAEFAGISDEVSENLPALANLRKAIEEIRPAVPDVNRVIQDLLGRQVAGWRFAYLSEFKQSRIAATASQGDSLRLRLDLDLVDAYTNAPYRAIVYAMYGMEGDSWKFRSVRPLLVTNEPDVNYVINDQLFPVGTWRWQDHFATFTPDGYWTGTWDNGQTTQGEWSIVDGKLVRTRNGYSWHSEKILSFGPSEILLDGGWGGQIRAERASGGRG